MKKYVEGESKEERKLRKDREKDLQDHQVMELPDIQPHNLLVKHQNYILCLKHGTKYSAEYVNKLYNMVSRHCTIDFTFVCLTEDSTNLNPKILVVPLRIPDNLKGWWCKPYIFSNKLGLTGTILYMDLDVVIANNIDHLFTFEKGHWCTIRDFTRKMRPNWEKYNSSVIRFDSGQLDHLWQSFKSSSTLIQRKYFGDQDWLYDVTKNLPAKLFPDEWIQSWKWEIRKSKEFAAGGSKGNRKLKTIEHVQPKDTCCICVFHGDPNPHNCEDSWVWKNWR
tara:strand:- start:24 stop:860 length:837 start_codon:yes stop_codon:yes gene_type:complete